MTAPCIPILLQGRVEFLVIGKNFCERGAALLVDDEERGELLLVKSEGGWSFPHAAERKKDLLRYEPALRKLDEMTGIACNSVLRVLGSYMEPSENEGDEVRHMLLYHLPVNRQKAGKDINTEEYRWFQSKEVQDQLQQPAMKAVFKAVMMQLRGTRRRAETTGILTACPSLKPRGAKATIAGASDSRLALAMS